MTFKQRLRFRLRSLRRGYLFKICSVLPIYRIVFLGDRSDPFLYLYLLSFLHRKSKLYYLCSFSWYADDTMLSRVLRSYKRFKRFFPKHEFYFLANTLEELESIKVRNLKAIFCSKDCFVDERVYRILNADKRFDALYDGRLTVFKRHQLAQKIGSLALISYLLSSSQDDTYISETKRLLAHAEWCNDPTLPNSRFLSGPEINEIVNQSHVGLILSAHEGANNATVQYLLAGIPVVSTPNKGGRDVFLTPNNSITAEPNPEAVAEAVQMLIERNLSAEELRSEVLEIIQEHRERFFQLIEDLCREEGVDFDFRKWWSARFFDKMIHFDVSWKNVIAFYFSQY